MWGIKGSGKSIYGAFRARLLEQEAPKLSFVSNMSYNTVNARKYPDMLSALAMKVICKSKKYWDTFIDEVAIAGWEARGSYTEDSSLRTYLVMLSRKVECELTFASQMISQMDKRLQWTGEFNILCKAHRVSDPSIRANLPQRLRDFPDWFSYTVFDEELNGTSIKEITAPDAIEYLIDYYDDREIPLADEMISQLVQNYRISKEQWEQFIEMENLKDDQNSESYLIAKKWVDLASTDETRPEQVKQALGTLMEGCRIYEDEQTIYVSTMFHGKKWKDVRDALESCYPPLFYVSKELSNEWSSRFVDKKKYDELVEEKAS